MATTTYGLNKPTVGGSEDTWGTSLNANADLIDDLLDGTEVVTGIKMDDTASIVDNADNTKVAQFQASGITTATTRTFTFPDASGTLMLTSAIGSTVQAYDAGLASIAGLTTAADRMIYTTGLDTYAVATLTAAGRALLDDADAAAQRTTLGLGNIATTDLIDEDDMASNTAAQAPTQQSVKAYVDASVSSVHEDGEDATTSGIVHSFTGIPAGINHIDVNLNGISLSGTDSLLIQLSTGGAFAVSGYVSTSGGVTSTGQSQVSSTSGIVVQSVGATNEITGIVTLSRVPGTNTWISAHSIRLLTNSIAAGGGSVTLGGVLDGVRLTRTGSDTFDAGGWSIRCRE